MCRVGIIIPSYNNSFYLENCVESIFDKIGSKDFRIIIVDNASTEHNLKRLLSVFKKEKTIHIIENDRNLGYGRAVNLGISLIKNKYNSLEYILILNQDTRLLNNIFEKSIKIMQEREKVGICGPRLFNPDGTIQNSFYNFHTVCKRLAQLVGLKNLSGFFMSERVHRFFNAFLPFFAKTYLKNFENLEKPIEVPWINGACFMVRKQVFDDISGFDGNYKMYAEDMDFCLNAREKGWKIYYIPQAHVIHYGGSKPSKRSKELANIYYDSLSYYYKKNFNGLEQKLMLLLNDIERRIKLY